MEPEVPKNILLEEVIPPQGSIGFVVKKGRCLRITDIEGQQVGDFTVINEHNLKEHYDSYRTQRDMFYRNKDTFSTLPDGVIVGGTYLSSGIGNRLLAGHKLISNINNAMMTVIADTQVPSGVHDMRTGRCSRWTYEERGLRPRKGCLELFVDALSEWGFTKPEDIPENMCLFMNVPIDPATGLYYIEEPVTKPGDYIEFRAEMDCICALTACPDNDTSKCNGIPPHPPKPLHLRVYEEK
jgi:uncharacterized protein YcgI (DUF1989 family)